MRVSVASDDFRPLVSHDTDIGVGRQVCGRSPREQQEVSNRIWVVLEDDVCGGTETQAEHRGLLTPTRLARD